MISNPVSQFGTDYIFIYQTLKRNTFHGKRRQIRKYSEDRAKTPTEDLEEFLEQIVSSNAPLHIWPEATETTEVKWLTSCSPSQISTFILYREIHLTTIWNRLTLSMDIEHDMDREISFHLKKLNFYALNSGTKFS